MIRTFITFLLILSASIAVCADTIHIDTLSDNLPRKIDVHLRAKGQWSLIWDATDSNNYRMATVTPYRTDPEDYTFGMASKVSVTRVSDGKQEDNVTQIVKQSCDQFSLRLMADEFGARLYCGDGEEFTSGKISIDAHPASHIFATADRQLAPTVKRNNIEYYRPAIQCPFSDIASLDEYLNATTDPIEGRWRFLDRNIDTEYSTLGGSYKLAIVKNNGANIPEFVNISNNAAIYDIVYIGGAALYDEFWNFGDIKGWMVATPFAGEYDLYWLDAKRQPAAMTLTDNTTENSATVTNSALLTLKFPLLKAEIRLSRQQ